MVVSLPHFQPDGYNLFEGKKSFFHSTICRLKTIYHNITKQVSLLNDFLDIIVLLG